MVVWDNGSSPEVAAALDRLAGDRVQVHHAAENHGFALGNNLALAHATGDVVVFLNNDTTVPPGWLAPLREALDDPDVLGAQPLLLYPSGTIQSAGIAFPTCGGLPHAFLQGFPAEDAYGVEGLRFHALTGAALALRFRTRCALRGFDPVFTNGMEDVDLCHRLAQRRDGHFRVLDAAPVVHHESRTPGRYDKHLANRAVYLDRWQRVVAPRDDAALWATRGLRVVDHEIGPARHGEPPRLRIPRPVLVREARLQVTENPPAALGDQEPRAGRRGRGALGRHPLRGRHWPRRCASTARRWWSTGGRSGTAPPAATTTSSWCCAGWSATTPAPSRSRCCG